MKNLRRLYALSALGLVGFLLSAYQTYHFYLVRSGTAELNNFCTFGKFDCVAIESSRYAELIFGIPLSAFAAGWFLLISILGFMAQDAFSRRNQIRILLALTSFGLLTSAVYLGIMVGIIKSFCLLCLGVDGLFLALFLITLSMKDEWASSTPTPFAEWKKHIVGGSALILVTVGVLAICLSQTAGPKVDPNLKDYVVQKILQAPVKEITNRDDQSSIGPKDAPITIVKFSDFQCPHCQIGARGVAPVLKRYKDQVRFVFKNFPLDSGCNRVIESPMHPFACEAAKYSYCATKQNHFEEVYHQIFDRQAELSSEVLKNIAENAHLDMAALDACLKAPATDQAIKEDIEEGIRLGVGSTPTFFINGRMQPGALQPDVWFKVIDSLLKK